MKRLLVSLSFSSLSLMISVPVFAADTIKIGFNIPLTDDIPKVGESSKFAAEMLKTDINGTGGLEVGGKKYQLEFIYEDNESKADESRNPRLKAEVRFCLRKSWKAEGKAFGPSDRLLFLQPSSF